jgi:hypothetical protein
MAADFDKKRDRKSTGEWPRNTPEQRVQAKTKSDSSGGTPLFLQRSLASPAAPMNGEAIAEPAQTATTAEPAADVADLNNAPGRILIVEDSVEELEPGQLRRSEFLALLRLEVTNAAEDALSGTMWSTLGCPWIDRWFNYYGERSSGQIERAIYRYAPEANGITTAGDLIPIMCGRVRDAISVWSTTGEMTQDVPPDLAVTGARAEGGDSHSETGNVFRKEREGALGDSNSPGVIKGGLDSGGPLDAGVRSNLESAYGEDFSHVRVHTGASAAAASESLNARAFTVGQDIAFGANEYQPGTPIGDALIAHELAHVMQQRSGAASGMPAQKAATEHSDLEEDADQAAVGAVVSTWGGARNGLAGVAKSTMPSLKSGLKLQRCGRETEQKKEGKLLEAFAAKFPDAAEIISKSEPARALVKEAEAAGAKFGGYAEDGPDHDIWPYTRNGIVYVPKAHTDKITAMRDFLFELNNAMREPTYAKLAREAEKGSAGQLTAKEFARQIVEQEVEGMLRLGKTWVEMKKGFGGGTEFDKYDKDFFLVEYNDYTEGRKTKDDIVNDTLKVVYQVGEDAGKTVEQHYIDEYNKKSGGK